MRNMNTSNRSIDDTLQIQSLLLLLLMLLGRIERRGMGWGGGGGRGVVLQLLSEFLGMHNIPATCTVYFYDQSPGTTVQAVTLR